MQMWATLGILSKNIQINISLRGTFVTSEMAMTYEL